MSASHPGDYCDHCSAHADRCHCRHCDECGEWTGLDCDALPLCSDCVAKAHHELKVRHAQERLEHVGWQFSVAYTRHGWEVEARHPTDAAKRVIVYRAKRTDALSQVLQWAELEQNSHAA